MSTLIDRVIRWQLGYPDGTIEECKSWLKQQHDSKALGDLPPAVGAQPERRKKRKVTTETTPA